MRAARITQVNQPLQIQELKTPKPIGSQVLDQGSVIWCLP